MNFHTALSTLAGAYRSDWSNFDGRDLENEIDALIAADAEGCKDFTPVILSLGLVAREWTDSKTGKVYTFYNW